MSLTFIDSAALAQLEREAQQSPRRRQHRNLHRLYSDPAQRLLNCLCEDTYIRPHKHVSAGNEETLIAVRGLFGLISFDEHGAISEVRKFGSELYASDDQAASGVIVQPTVWHTVLALSSAAVLLECKGGPFLPDAAKDLAPWAPEEGGAYAMPYFERLRGCFRTEG